jgi:hypothetical protein
MSKEPQVLVHILAQSYVRIKAMDSRTLPGMVYVLSRCLRNESLFMPSLVFIP